MATFWYSKISEERAQDWAIQLGEVPKQRQVLVGEKWIPYTEQTDNDQPITKHPDITFIVSLNNPIIRTRNVPCPRIPM